jgi:hypothetical protein
MWGTTFVGHASHRLTNVEGQELLANAKELFGKMKFLCG